MRSSVPVLKASAEFQRISKQGRRFSAPAFIIQFLRREKEAPFRFGLTASRKVGNAVVRNRAKRRLREIIRAVADPAAWQGIEIVIIAKTAAATRDFALMKEDFLKGMNILLKESAK